MSTKQKKQGYVDNRNKTLAVGDVVLVRHVFPKTAKLSTGKVTAFRFTLHGDLQVKIEGCKEWFFNPWKLAK